MKRIIALLMLTGCSASELVDICPMETKTDTTQYIPRRDSTERVEITFLVTINEWEEHDF